jgi:Ala-tRNA(Pro) deacylase
MPPIDARLQKLLDENEVEYEVLHHPADVGAHSTAAHTHTADRDFAKTVVMWIDGTRAFAVVPASHHVAPSRLARSLGAKEVRLATEAEMQDCMPDCELGAEPPFGALYGMATYASPVLAGDERITFNGGTHRDAVRMRWSDYERLAKPQVVPLSRHEDDTN